MTAYDPTLFSLVTRPTLTALPSAAPGTALPSAAPGTALPSAAHGTALPSAAHGFAPATSLGASPGAAYEISYFTASGRLLARHTATCANDTQAGVLAHAMRPDGARRIEVWRGAYLVLERPHTSCAAAPVDIRAQHLPAGR